MEYNKQPQNVVHGSCVCHTIQGLLFKRPRAVGQGRINQRGANRWVRCTQARRGAAQETSFIRMKYMDNLLFSYFSTIADIRYPTYMQERVSCWIGIVSAFSLADILQEQSRFRSSVWQRESWLFVRARSIQETIPIPRLRKVSWQFAFAVTFPVLYNREVHTLWLQ